MDKIIEILVSIMSYLPDLAGQAVHDNFDMGLGMTPDQIADIFSGCEVLGLVVVGVILVKRIMRKRAQSKPKPKE